MTKDEQFLIKFYELSPTEALHYLTIGRAIGQNDRGAYVIARDLAQANFIKKSAGEGFYTLTPHGAQLVRCLLKEKT
jgi:hypothetical protein